MVEQKFKYTDLNLETGAFYLLSAIMKLPKSEASFYFTLDQMSTESKRTLALCCLKSHFEEDFERFWELNNFQYVE